jgi:hypothetical protein
MDDAALGTARLFGWLLKPNATDEPDHHETGTAVPLHAVEYPPKDRPALPLAAE